MRPAVATLGAWTAFVVVCIHAADVDYPKAVAEAQKQNDLAEVNRLCTEWSVKSPGDEQPRLILGHAFRKAGMFDRAIEQYELAIEANPLSPAPHCELGTVFLGAGDLEQADEEFGQAFRLAPTCVPAALGLARIKLRKGDATGALADARKACSADPDSVEGLVVVGDCLLATGKIGQALSALKRAADLDPDDADVLFGLAKARQAHGDEVEASGLWQRFLELEPSGARADTVKNGWVLLRTESHAIREPSYPVWSPDGKRILHGYANPHITDLRDGTTVDLRDPDGDDLFDHDWSPDGTRLVFFRKEDGRHPVFVYELLDGGALRLVGATPWTQGIVPRFSPDGDKLLVSNMRDSRHWRGGMGIVDLATRELTPIGWRHPRRIAIDQGAWAPDGQTIVFHAHPWPEGADDRALFVMGIRNRGSAKKLTTNGLANWHPVVSPDGRGIAYDVEGPSGRTVAMVRLDGAAGPCTLAAGGTPGWSPDGHRLAYSVHTGQTQIVIAHLGGLDSRPVGITAEREGTALSVVVTSRSKDAQQVNLRWEAFDENSFRIDPACESEEPAELPPGGELQWTLEMSPEQLADTRTLKVRVLNQTGAGAVELVDWVQGGE